MKNNIIKLTAILFVMLILIGIIIIMTSNIISLNMNKYDNIQLVTITKIDNEKVYVQVGEKNGDPIIYEVANLKNSNRNIGEEIYIGIKNGKAKYLPMLINTYDLEHFGTILILAPFTLCFFIGIFWLFIFFPIVFIKHNKLSLLESIQVVLFVIGSIILILFAEENKFDIWMILGLSFTLGSSCIIVLLDLLKNKKK